MSHSQRPGSTLETFLGLFLVLLLASAVLGLLALITMGALLLVLAVPIGMFVLIAIHYVLWGWLVEARRNHDSNPDDEEETPP